MAQNTLTITDNRTNQVYTLPVENGTIRAMDLRQIKASPEDFGLVTYDPTFMNTASCRSSVTFIDGDRGILRYRGYPIETVAEHCSFLGVGYVVPFRTLPNETSLTKSGADSTQHTRLHSATMRFMECSRYNAQPRVILISTVAALSTV